MFTIEQIKAAHSKVKSGKDFPAYIQEIKALGVTRYESHVVDGHTDYHGADDYTAQSPAKYELVTIAESLDKEHFITELKAHQQGKTDFPTFIQMCAVAGIEKWEVRMDEMTCTYYDKSGNKVLVEEIPQ